MKEYKTYEEASQKLHELVNLLDNDEIKLEDLAEKIKEARDLIEFCTTKLRLIEDSVKSATQEGEA
jgi:exodeoxyribonuclease VII small subunit